MVYKSGPIFLPFCHNPRVWQTDGRTDGQTEISSQYRGCITCSAVKVNFWRDHELVIGSDRPDWTSLYHSMVYMGRTCLLYWSLSTLHGCGGCVDSQVHLTAVRYYWPPTKRRGI